MRSANIEREMSETGRLIWWLGLLGLAVFLLFDIEFFAVSSSLLLGALLVARAYAKRCLNGLRVEISQVDRRARCGENVAVRLELSNGSRWLPACFPIIELQLSSDPGPQWTHCQQVVRAGGSLQLSALLPARARGAHQVAVVGIRSRFPFGLYEARSHVHAQSDTVTIWPRLAALDVASLFKDPPQLGWETRVDQVARSTSPELARIRDYQVGDPRRSINWKISARRDKLTIIEAGESKEERIDLLLDPAAALWPSELHFERMLSLVFRLVSDLSDQRRLHSVTLQRSVFPTSNPRELTRLFDALAVLQPDDSEGPPRESWEARGLRILPDSHSGIALSAYPERTARTAPR